MKDIHERPDRPTRLGRIQINKVTIVSGCVIVVSLIASATALGIAGWAPTAIAGLLGSILGVATPVLLLLDRVIDMQRETDAQTDTLHVVAGRVNGELDARIESAVQRALGTREGPPDVSGGDTLG